MARRLIGTGITNNQGIAIMNKDPQGNTITGYTGVGAGKLDIIAVSGDLQSETYELIDATVNQTGKTTGWYQSGVTLENNRVKWTYAGTYDSTNQKSPYASVRSGALAEKLAGLKFNIDYKIQSDKAIGIAAYYQDPNGPSGNWNNIGVKQIPANNTSEDTLTVTCPPEASVIWIRFQTTTAGGSLEDDDIVYIDKLVVYPTL